MKKQGFTLAEVLITLGIIGIIAAMTLPTLITTYKEKQTVSQLKKAYSALSQAYLMVLSEHGAPADWGLPSIHDPAVHSGFLEKLSPNLNLLKDCGIKEDGCYTKSIRNINGKVVGTDTLNSPTAKAIFTDGSAIALRAWNTNCQGQDGLLNVCAFFEIDVNGLKKPNQYGRDIFRFYVTPKTIIPYGTQEYGEAALQTFQSSCIIEGYACTAWVLFNENMDYLHCPEKLGWDKAKSCKD